MTDQSVTRHSILRSPRLLVHVKPTTELGFSGNGSTPD